ncbi:MAG: helix-turn-helix domain-containing protein [Clostridia bacterium]|nr:helix-turn-helix domain-containing protein [Clostridia bacterium]
MDQIRIGKFIAEMRKEKGLTQRQLADILLISDKTVSKWECGKGLPEVSLMLPLCETLGINVNELLSGEQLSAVEYQEKAEDNIMRLINEREENKKKMILSGVTVGVTIMATVTLFLVSGLTVLPNAARIALIVIGLLVMIGGLGVAAVLEWDAGGFVCPHCKEYFVPTMKAYLMGAHTITRRHLKCPACGKKSYCIRSLGKK